MHRLGRRDRAAAPQRQRTITLPRRRCRARHQTIAGSRKRRAAIGVDRRAAELEFWQPLRRAGQRIYLEMSTRRAAPSLCVLLSNLGVIPRVKLSGARRVEALLEQAGRAPHLDERGTIRAGIDTGTGLLRKISKEPELARQFLEKARARAELQGATRVVTKIDAALAEL